MRPAGQSDLSQDQVAIAYQQGLAALETARYAEAIELLDPVAKSDSLCATLARFYLGQAHMHRGINEFRDRNHVEAIRHFMNARELNPASTTLSRYLAACFSSQRRFDLAITELERDETIGAPDADRSIRLAHAFARDGQFERAVETLVKVIDAQPHRADARVQLGLLYAAAERFEDAVCVLTEAVEAAPFDADAHHRLGLTLAAAGDHSQAVEHLAVAQKLRPQDATIALMLAMATDAARSHCIKVAVDPVHGRLGVVDDRSLDTLGDLIARDPEFVEAFLSLP
ncbi:MAG TPA: tetratricopeptide repeat protein, partial [Phycisphaerae bacterium]|nr:tetratricopeptide repeat protein [Phycisphaerae bacterium]